jgi:hypothetical protein
MDDPYVELRQSFTQAGFYMPSTENMGTWQRLIVCSQGPPEHPAFNGRSFWVAQVSEAWYVGAWGGYIYRVSDRSKLLPLTRDFLSDGGSMGDFSADVKQRYDLQPLDEAEIDRILPDDRLEN